MKKIENESVMLILQKEMFKITFSSDFDMVPQDLFLKQGGSFSSGDLKELSVIGYRFLGWYNGGTKVESGFTVDRDILLVAKWEKCAINAVQLHEFMAAQTDELSVYDVSIADMKPDMELIAKALDDNPKIKVNLNLEKCTGLKEISIMPADGSVSKSTKKPFLVNLISLTIPDNVTSIILDCDGLTSII